MANFTNFAGQTRHLHLSRRSSQSDPVGRFLHCRDRGFAESGGSRDIPFDTEGFRCRLSTAVTRTTPDSYGLEFESTDIWDRNDLRVRIEPQPDGRASCCALSETRTRTT